MLTKAPRGTKDVLPSESYKWHYLEDKYVKLQSFLDIRKLELLYLTYRAICTGCWRYH